MTNRRGLTAQTPLSTGMHSWIGWWGHAQRKEFAWANLRWPKLTAGEIRLAQIGFGRNWPWSSLTWASLSIGRVCRLESIWAEFRPRSYLGGIYLGGFFLSGIDLGGLYLGEIHFGGIYLGGIRFGGKSERI